MEERACPAAHLLQLCSHVRRYPEDEVIDRLQNAIGLDERVRLGEALLNKALGVFQHGDADAAIKIVEEVVRRFGSAEEPALKQEVAIALHRKAAFLRESGRGEAALMPFKEIIARYGGSPDAEDPAIQYAVADAYFSLGFAHQLRKEYRPAEIAYIEARAYADRSADPTTRELSAIVLINQVIIRLVSGDGAGARLYLDEFDDRFGTLSGPTYDDQRAKAVELRRAMDGH